jgi:hypothetical protein
VAVFWAMMVESSIILDCVMLNSDTVLLDVGLVWSSVVAYRKCSELEQKVLLHQ